MCEEWRNRSASDDIIGDIYDGQVWREFSTFRSHENSWCLALNVDWFQPFSHVTDSVGVIYLCILNLPRSEIYKRENMLLVSIIPGPHEPSQNINSYLTPLVLELQQFYQGVSITSISSNGFKVITLRMALIGVFCDLPASRKFCGFSSFNALHGCNKCLKRFPTNSFGEKPDYSGYNTSEWAARDLDLHKKLSLEHLNASTKSRQKSIEKDHGLKYSTLIDLPYFNPIRFMVIDPMHNLFLGTSKHCMEVYSGILSVLNPHLPSASVILCFGKISVSLLIFPRTLLAIYWILSYVAVPHVTLLMTFVPSLPLFCPQITFLFLSFSLFLLKDRSRRSRLGFIISRRLILMPLTHFCWTLILVLFFSQMMLTLFGHLLRVQSSLVSLSLHLWFVLEIISSLSGSIQEFGTSLIRCAPLGGVIVNLSHPCFLLT